MTYKDALLGLLLIGAIAATYFAAGAKREIDRIKAESDSIATVRDSAFKVLQAETQYLNDSLKILHKRSADDASTADKAEAHANSLRHDLASARSTADSLQIALHLADTLDVAVQSLKSARRSDSLQIVILTANRDKWQSEADSLRHAMLKINSNVGAVAAIAKHEVNLGIIKIPADVAKMGLAAATGYGLAKAF